MTYDTVLDICLFGASACILIVLWRLVEAWPTLGWGRTEGVVEKAYLAEEESKDPTSFSTHTKLYVDYNYTVRGKTCRCSRVSLNEPLSFTKRGDQAAVARYPPGLRVRVYYSRWSPDGNAVLKRATIGWFTRSCALAAIGFLATGAIVSNEALREAAERCASDLSQCRTAFAPLLEPLSPAADPPSAR